MNVKPGDIVLVEAYVSKVAIGGTCSIHVLGGSNTNDQAISLIKESEPTAKLIFTNRIISIVEQPIQVGDDVVYKSNPSGTKHKVLGIMDNEIWLKEDKENVTYTGRLSSFRKAN